MDAANRRDHGGSLGAGSRRRDRRLENREPRGTGRLDYRYQRSGDIADDRRDLHDSGGRRPAEGMAVVSMDIVDDVANPGRDGYIDKTGKMVVQPQYYWGDPFSGGLARVAPWYDEISDWGMWYPPDKYRYIDNTGQTIWPRE